MKTIHLEDRVVHIVKTPEEAEQLKRTKSGDSFDWHFHGSPEHVESLKKAHELRTTRANSLREQHPDVHAEMDRIRHEMDTLSHELEGLTTSPVELEANFDKFGYSARIRAHAKDDDMEKNEGDFVDGAIASGIGLRDKRPPKPKSTTIPIYKRPVLRQYFHNGLLYRAHSAEEVASFELFIDLLYVGIIAFNGDKATEDPTGKGFLRFCVTFIPSWKIWSDVGTLVSQFETNDIVQRTVILFVLACLVGYTINIVEAFDTTYSQLIAFFLAARVCAGCVMLKMSIVLPHVRNVMYWNIALGLISISLWLGTIFLEDPRRIALIWVALVWDLLAPMFTIVAIRSTLLVSDRFHKKMMKIFDYFPALNIEHKTERTGAFVSLVFGYSVVALLYQNRATFGMNAFFGKAILALIQAYCFNMMYFDIDGSYHHVHAIRRHAISSSVWTTAHLPFIMAFTLSGAALSRLVVAHDCPNADPTTLTETYEEKSEAELAYGWRWFYCCGLGVAFFCMTIISTTHIHVPLATQRLRKRTRHAFRLITAIIWMCLPLATSLNSLELIGTTTAMTVLALAVDIYGMSSKEESFFLFYGESEYDCKGISRSRSRSSEVGSMNSAEKEHALYDYLVRT